MMSRKMLRASGLTLIALSILLLIVAAIRGELELLLIVVIPVIRGEGMLSALGGILLFLGILLSFLSFLVGFPDLQDKASEGDVEPSGEKRGEGRFGGVILIGPIPIVLGSDRGIALWVIVIAIIVLIVVSLSLFLWFK
jgi:uncharacterized protein (TIGR00304 family)